MGVIGNIGGSGGGQGTPESLVVGTGSYTVPAGKFGYVSMSTASTSSGGAGIQSTSGQTTGSGSGSANSNHQWVPAGTSITTSISSPSGNTGVVANTARRETEGFAEVRLNGTRTCVSNSSAQGVATRGGSSVGPAYTEHDGRAGWSVAIYSA